MLSAATTATTTGHSHGGRPVRCAVWGSPIAHSLSPVLHQAAYRALSLEGWTYDRREVDEESFAVALEGLDQTWRGLSLTMPLKEAALAAAARATVTAEHTGVANTLVRDGTGWVAHNTDVQGITEAITEAITKAGGADRAGSRAPRTLRTALVIGSGATARSALVALCELGLTEALLMTRGEVRPATAALAERLGLRTSRVALGEWSDVDVVVSTVPPTSLGRFDELPGHERPGEPPILLDAVYGSGATPLQQAAAQRGWLLAQGTAMLLHQAAAQVRLMTGRPAPLAAMRAALDRAVADRSRIPDPSEP